jgi:hypothetical protein
MKLKPIIAAMLLVGVSSPVLAAMATNAMTQPQLDAMNARISRVEGLMNQNQAGTGLGVADTQNWFNSVTISGVLNVDALASNRTPNDDFNYTHDYRTVSMYDKEHSNNFRLADANVLVDAVINCWTSAHIGANFRALSNIDADSDHLEHALVVSDFGLPIVDEAYITVMNAASPFYGRFGRQYVSFGDYSVYEAVPSLTQLLSETNQVAAVVGYSDPSTLGVNVYGFRGLESRRYGADRSLVENFGATLSFGDVDTMGYKVGLGYLNNMADVAYISNQLTNGFGQDGSSERVNAMSANAAFKSGPFDAAVKYVTALDEFNRNEIGHDLSNSSGAEPWAVTAGVGYSFNTMQWPARFGFSYQQSGDAANIGTQGMPERRYQADFNVGVSKNTNVGFTLFNDRDYDRSEGGSGRNALTGVLRLGVDIV